MTHKVVFSREAREDLPAIYDYIADTAGAERALRYVERIADDCRGFDHFPERGTRRDDLLPGLRMIGFERRVSIAFHVSEDTVTFDRILYGGRGLPPISGSWKLPPGT